DAFVLRELEHLDDVRMVDPRSGSPFAEEPLAGGRVGDVLRVDDLDGDALAEAKVPPLVDRGHPTAADGAYNLVASEDCPRLRPSRVPRRHRRVLSMRSPGCEPMVRRGNEAR